MAAEVEVQSAEVGRSGGCLHLSPLTDSNNKNLLEISPMNQSRLISPEPSKPAPGPKPRLTPKPFTVDRNPSIRPIPAPKPQPKPRPESTRLTGYKPITPKPPTAPSSSTSKPSSTRPASTSFRTSKLNAGETTKPVAQPFVPAPPLDGDPSKPISPILKPANLTYSRSLKRRPSAEWSGSTKKEERDLESPNKVGTSITRTKSMGYLLQIGKEEEEKTKLEASVPLRAHARGTRPRPVSAIYPTTPTKAESPNPPFPRTERRPLSTDLTSKFESVGLSFRKTSTAKENSPENSLQKKEQVKSPSPQVSSPETNKPAVPDQSKENVSAKDNEDMRGASIKSRISLLLDSSVSPVTPAPGQAPDNTATQAAPEAEPAVGVKQLIRQLTVDQTTPNQSPVQKPALKPRPLPLDLTKRFSPDPMVSPGDASDRHDTGKSPEKRGEDWIRTPNDEKTFVDLKDWPHQIKTPVSEEPVLLRSPKESEAHMVRASVFENVVEKRSILMVDENKSDLPMIDKPAEEGKLVTATYKEPVSPSGPVCVVHAIDTVPAAGGSTAVSESVPSAQWEDKPMTLRTRRQEGTKTAPEKPSPEPISNAPRFLRVGALQKWMIDDDVDLETGMPKDKPRDFEVEDVSAAAKRLKTQQMEEQAKPRATYFALTGQMQETVTAIEAGDSLALSDPNTQWSPQGKVLPFTRNPSLDEAFAKAPENDAYAEGQLEKQKQLESERQAELEFGRLKEREMQREFERQRQKAFEKETQEFEEKGRVLEINKQIERERLKHLEFEKQRQVELKRQRQMEKEKQKQLEIDRQRPNESERQKEAEFERLRQMELETQRQIELENQRLFELKKQKQDLERQKQLEMERQKQIETERKRQIELERQEQIETERLRQIELEKQYQIELENQRQLEIKKRKQELERQKQLEAEKQRQIEIQRQKQFEAEKQRQVELERQKQQKEIERQKQIELEKQRQMELEWQKLQEIERVKQLELELEERQRQLERERREMERERREMERQREEERLQKELDKEQKLMEKQMERQRLQAEAEERERRQQAELQKQRERQQVLEVERQRLREKMEKEQAEKLRHMALEQEKLRIRELEKERERQKEMEREKQRELELQRQRELELQRLRELEKQRQRQLDQERQELEMQRQKQQEQEKERQRKEELERIKELEKRQLQEFEKHKQAERQQIHEQEKRRLREKMDREEAERMRQIAKQQEAERRRLKDKQKKEEQERIRLESAALRPKVVDIDSVLRNDLSKGSPRGDPSTRWKEPSPKSEQSLRPGTLDIDSFTSHSQPSPSRDLFPVVGFHEVDQRVPMSPQNSGGLQSPVWTTSPQDPWEQRSVEMSVDTPEQPKKPLSKTSLEQLLLRQEERRQAPQRRWSGLVLDDPFHMAPFSEPETKPAPSDTVSSSSSTTEQVWLHRDLPEGRSRSDGPSHRRTLGSQELNRIRSRSMSRRSAPSSNTVESSLSRMRSRSAHRDQARDGWVQQNNNVSTEDESKDSETPVHETDSQYGTWETGLRSEDSLTPATPSSDSNLSPSPKKPISPQTPGDHTPHLLTDATDGLPPRVEPLPFPDAPVALLDNSALRSRAQLGKKRAPRSRPSRAAKQTEAEGGASDDWIYKDSTEEKVENKKEDSDSEEQPKASDAGPTAASSQPQRVALFPGMDQSALMAQLKKRGESDQADGPTPAPSQLSRSPKSPFLPRANRVLPPAGGKENGVEDSPQWLKELKSKKRLSQYENES
uniref:Si:ch73-138n13.1 n=1 Tax=Neogobius melanostomus TaxID=47308 RepID=A0A8C6UQ60_9GOBI